MLLKSFVKLSLASLFILAFSSLGSTSETSEKNSKNSAVINNSNLSIVIYGADYCGWCHKLYVEMESQNLTTEMIITSGDNKFRIPIIVKNIEDPNESAGALGSGIPEIQYRSGDKVLKYQVGYRPVDNIKKIAVQIFKDSLKNK